MADLMRIPKEIPLAWYPVKIEIKDTRWMADAVKCQKCGTKTDGSPADGYWDKDTRTIYVDGSMSLAAQRYIILHEQVHAAIDAVDHYLDTWTVSDRPWKKLLGILPRRKTAQEVPDGISSDQQS